MTQRYVDAILAVLLWIMVSFSSYLTYKIGDHFLVPVIIIWIVALAFIASVFTLWAIRGRK